MRLLFVFLPLVLAGCAYEWYPTTSNPSDCETSCRARCAQELCQTDKSLSIMFIVDASQSIGRDNWDQLTEFLRSGARFLPNSIKIGFIKFSTDVSYSEWLQEGWSKRDFKDAVPTKYDDGYTNTPAAIDKAAEMFKDDHNTEKIAILITDGMPVIDDGIEKFENLQRTKEACIRLQNDGVHFTILGYGPELQRQDTSGYIKEWVKDPEEDYFSIPEKARSLKPAHMKKLLTKACKGL